MISTQQGRDGLNALVRLATATENANRAEAVRLANKCARHSAAEAHQSALAEKAEESHQPIKAKHHRELAKVEEGRIRHLERRIVYLSGGLGFSDVIYDAEKLVRESRDR